MTLASIPWVGVSYNGASMVLPIQDELLEILNDGINPYLDDIQASDLQLLYKKSDGSFGVTNGSLADPNLGRAYVAAEPDPGESEEPEQPIEAEDPGQTGQGETTPGEPVISGDPTAPGSSDSQDPGQTGTGAGETGE